MLAKKGLKLVAMNTWPSQQIFSTVPIRTVADWKGKKIRVYGADSANISRLLGAAPVNIAFGEVYSALEKKTVDGAMTSATNAEPMKFFEVAKFIDYWYLAGAAQEWMVVNQKAWDALPKDLQQIVLDALKESNLEEKEWEDAIAADEKARKRHSRARHDHRRPVQGGDREGAQDRQGRLGHLALAHRPRRQARVGAGAEGPRAVIARAAGVAGLLAGFATLAIVLLISYDVGMRYFFDQPQLFVDELASFLQVLVIFGGAAYTFRAGGHVRVDLLTGHLRPGGARVAARGDPRARRRLPRAS